VNSTTLTGPERHRVVTEQVQRDKADGLERRILPASTLVREQPAVGAMHENDRAEALSLRQRRKHARNSFEMLEMCGRV
jgi:hypothetical protein